jgi:hypothetical protein
MDGRPRLVVWDEHAWDRDPGATVAKITSEVGVDAVVQPAADVEGFEYGLFD